MRASVSAAAARRAAVGASAAAMAKAKKCPTVSSELTSDFQAQPLKRGSTVELRHCTPHAAAGSGAPQQPGATVALQGRRSVARSGAQPSSSGAHAERAYRPGTPVTSCSSCSPPVKCAAEAAAAASPVAA